MNAVEHLAWAQSFAGLTFLFAFGAIVGSFLNVVVYRLPLGKGIVTPPSACPACDTPLRWNDNIPILGWFLVRARCRYCKTRISPEYMIVELLVALLFALIASAWFLRPSPLELLGINPAPLRPEWTLDGLARMWPMLGQIYLLIAALVAITLIDARTFMIPLILPWLVTAAAFLAHPLHAAWIGAHGGLRRSPFPWTIPTPTGPWLAATIAAALGLILALILMRFRIIPRSFADYDQWEKDTHAARALAAQSDAASPPPPAAHDTAVVPTLRRVFLLTGPALALMFLGFSLGLPMNRPFHGMAIGMAIGLLVGIALRRLGARSDPSNEPVWLAYPHARREMLKELLFLAIPTSAFALAWTLAPPLDADPPLWLSALAGSILGYLVGGAVVWAVRIFGSLLFGKEAMGLGDVHLMGAVGAVLGWIDATLAFFLAPALGLAWFTAAWATAKSRGKPSTALPFGPHLAAASLLALAAKPAFETILALMLARPINLP